MRWVSCIFVLLLAAGCGPAVRANAVEGTADLRSWRVDRDLATLAGEWELYWQREADGHPDGLVPTVLWGGFTLADGRTLPGQGWAIYRVKVRVPEAFKRAPRKLTFTTEGGNTAYRLSVASASGEALCPPVERGVVGHTREAARGSYRRAQITFMAAGDFTVALEISNFDTHAGGPWRAPTLGAAELVDDAILARRQLDFLVLGLLLVMALHHMAMFVLRPSEKGPLWLALFTVLLAVRLLLTERYFDSVLERGPWRLWLAVEILTFFLSVPMFVAFLHSVLPAYATRRFLRVSTAIAAPMVAMIVFLPPIWSSYAMTPYRLFTFVLVVKVLAVLVRATRSERDALPLFMLLGAGLLSVTVINDMLHAQGWIQTAYVAHYGMSGFILFQSLLLAVANARARRQSELSAAEMATLNEELRRQIGDRSHRLAETLTALATDVRRAAEIDPGTVIGERYRIEYLLGAGGMGAVYAATRLLDEKPVALKVVRLRARPDLLARFAREAEAAAKVNDPHVVAILDVDVSSDGQLFLVMERIDGCTLEERRDRFGDVGWALPLLAQLAHALQAIHAANVIHRDLKPGNVLLTRDSIVKVADFGIAGLSTDDAPLTGSGASSGSRTVSDRPLGMTSKDVAPTELTQAGVVLGSPMYMAPEGRAGAEHTSSQSDLFSFGLIAYEMLTGRRPFEHRGERRSDAPPLATLRPTLPAELSVLVDRCLHVSPGARPTAGEVSAAFASHVVVRARAV